MYPKISFITVVRNNAEGLRTTLTNISNIVYSNKEVVVIDGASTDQTIAVAQELAHEISFFLSEPDHGIYDAMNKGLRYATGDYVWFINAGDKIIDFDALYRNFASESSLCDIYYGDTQIVDLKGEVLGLRHKKLPSLLTLKSLRQGMVVSHQSFVVRRTIAPMYDTTYKYSADYDWMYQTIQAASTIKNVDGILSQFELGGATTAHHRQSLIERFSIMRRRFGLMRTIFSHICFIFDAIFTPTYR